MKKSMIGLLVLLNMLWVSMGYAEVVTRKESTRYHKTSCPFVTYIPASDKLTFATPDEAIKEGHKYACAVCSR